MDFKKQESTLRISLDRQEAVAFLADFGVLERIEHGYTQIGEFVYSNLQESVRKQDGFEVTLMSAVAVRDLLKDLNRLSLEMTITRVTKNLIDNLTYFLMSGNQKVRVYENRHFHPGLYL